jgi:hypothetical protein
MARPWRTRAVALEELAIGFRRMYLPLEPFAAHFREVCHALPVDCVVSHLSSFLLYMPLRASPYKSMDSMCALNCAQRRSVRFP